MGQKQISYFEQVFLQPQLFAHLELNYGRAKRNPAIVVVRKGILESINNDSEYSVNDVPLQPGCTLSDVFRSWTMVHYYDHDDVDIFEAKVNPTAIQNISIIDAQHKNIQYNGLVKLLFEELTKAGFDDTVTYVPNLASILEG